MQANSISITSYAILKTTMRREVAMEIRNSNVKVIILCGGMGWRLREETERLPKPLLEIGGKPILWHIMKIYAHYGFREFVLCLGYKGQMIKQYFLNYEVLNSDFTVELGTGNVNVHTSHKDQGLLITLAETGEKDVRWR